MIFIIYISISISLYILCSHLLLYHNNLRFVQICGDNLALFVTMLLHLRFVLVYNDMFIHAIPSGAF